MIKSWFIYHFPGLALRLRHLKGFGFEPEMILANLLVKPDSNTIDVGCHLANWSYRLSKLSQTVYAFEPHPLLVDNIQRAGIKNLVLYESALSDVEGFFELGLPVIDGLVRFGNASLSPQVKAAWDTTNTRPVKTSRLDSFNLNDISLLKIDVEGHEISVLQGASKLLQKWRPAVIVEIWDHTIHDFVTFVERSLGEYGYSTFKYTPETRSISGIVSSSISQQLIDAVPNYFPSMAPNYLLLTKTHIDLLQTKGIRYI